MNIINNIKKELYSKEFQNWLKTMILFFVMILIPLWFWMDLYFIIDSVALKYQYGFVEDDIDNLIIILGLIAFLILPLWMIHAIVFYVGRMISKKLGWYDNYNGYFNR